MGKGRRCAPGVWEGGKLGLGSDGEGIRAHGSVCIIQVGPSDPDFTSLGSSEEQDIRFGGIEVEVEENTYRKDMG